MGVLDGQRALITGGGSGIGLACAICLARDGASVLLMGRNRERLDRGAAEVRAAAPDSEVLTCAGDVTIEDDVAGAVAAAAGDKGLDIAVASAGRGALAPILVQESEGWDATMQTNLNGVFYTIKHAARSMASSDGGAICTISSIAGIRTHRYMGTYCVSKAAVDMLVRNSADELGQNNIRVNSVCPGLVDTEIATGLLTTDDVYNDYLDCMPISRNGVPDDIGQAVRFLCGPESSWITGVVLSVDGGHHLRRGPNVEPFSRARFGDDITEGRLGRD